MDENGNCQKCPSCPAGFDNYCEWGYLHKCKKCSKGTYKEYNGHHSCKRCKDCATYNRYEFWPCTMVQNTQCGGCKAGFYENASSECVPCGEGSDYAGCNDFKALTTTKLARMAIETPAKTHKKTHNEEQPERFTLSRNTVILVAAIASVMLVCAVFGIVSVLVSCINKSTTSEPGFTARKAKITLKFLN